MRLKGSTARIRLAVDSLAGAVQAAILTAMVVGAAVVVTLVEMAAVRVVVVFRCMGRWGIRRVRLRLMRARGRGCDCWRGWVFAPEGEHADQQQSQLQPQSRGPHSFSQM